MALITCSDCGNQVSSIAAACPKCGNPVANDKTTVTTQETSKNLKGHIVASVVLMILCTIGFISTAGTDASALAFIGGFLSLCYYVIIKISIWWEHK